VVVIIEYAGHGGRSPPLSPATWSGPDHVCTAGPDRDGSRQPTATHPSGPVTDAADGRTCHEHALSALAGAGSFSCRCCRFARAGSSQFRPPARPTSSPCWLMRRLNNWPSLSPASPACSSSWRWLPADRAPGIPGFGISIILLVCLSSTDGSISPLFLETQYPPMDTDRRHTDSAFGTDEIAYVLALAWYLRYRSNYRTFLGLIPPFALTLVPMALIKMQPDLGTLLLFLPVCSWSFTPPGQRQASGCHHRDGCALLPPVLGQDRGLPEVADHSVVLQNKSIRDYLSQPSPQTRNRPLAGNPSAPKSFPRPDG